MVVVTSSNGVAFQQRSSAGGEATTIRVVPTVRAPCWVRLARQNNVFTADYSADGQSWTSLGSATIQMQPDTWAGLAVTAHNASALCEASFDQFNFKSGGRAKPAAPPASGE